MMFNIIIMVDLCITGQPEEDIEGMGESVSC